MTGKKSIAHSVTITIEGIDYEIQYPNTGQQIDAELLKAKIADGNYDALRFSANPLFAEQADKIDMIATFNTLIPQLKKDLNVESLFHLSEELSDVLLKIYTEEFIPWYVEIKKAIKNPKNEE
jgi:hypothetical protein